MHMLILYTTSWCYSLCCTIRKMVVTAVSLFFLCAYWPWWWTGCPATPIVIQPEIDLVGLGSDLFFGHIDSGEAEQEYWSMLRGNQDRCRENKGNNNRGRYVSHPHSISFTSLLLSHLLVAFFIIYFDQKIVSFIMQCLGLLYYFILERICHMTSFLCIEYPVPQGYCVCILLFWMNKCGLHPLSVILSCTRRLL